MSVCTVKIGVRIDHFEYQAVVTIHISAINRFISFGFLSKFLFFAVKDYKIEFDHIRLHTYFVIVTEVLIICNMNSICEDSLFKI